MKKAIQIPGAPSPIGPYSQAILTESTLYMSGQIAINPANSELVLDSIEEETHQIMRNLGALLSEANMDYSNLVKCSIFLSNMDDFPIVNEVYGSYFTGVFPARETVQVTKLPLGVNVEISGIAIQ